MLMTVTELRSYITSADPDTVLEAKLSALELSIRGYTHNTFQVRGFRQSADISEGTFTVNNASGFSAGDTIQVSASALAAGVYSIAGIAGNTFTVEELVPDDFGVLVTKVIYPMDVKMGAVNLLKWDMNNCNKIGIQSETLSRHSVTYFNLDGENSLMGYPRSLLGFLKPYRKART